MKNFLFVLFTFYNLDALKFDNKNIGLTAAVCLTSMAAISAGIAYSLVQPPSSSQEPTSVSAIKFTSSNQSVIQFSSNKNISSVFLTNETVHNLIKYPNDFSTEIILSVTYGENIETVKLSYGQSSLPYKIVYSNELFETQQQVLSSAVSAGSVSSISSISNQTTESNQTSASYASFFLDIVNFALKVKKQEDTPITQIVSTSAPTFAPNSTNSTNSTFAPTFAPNNLTAPQKNKTKSQLISLTETTSNKGSSTRSFSSSQTQTETTSNKGSSSRSFSFSKSGTETTSNEGSSTRSVSFSKSGTKTLSNEGSSTRSLAQTETSFTHLQSLTRSSSKTNSITTTPTLSLAQTATSFTHLQSLTKSSSNSNSITTTPSISTSFTHLQSLTKSSSNSNSITTTPSISTSFTHLQSLTRSSSNSNSITTTPSISTSFTQSIRLCSYDSDCTVGKCYNNHCILLGIDAYYLNNVLCSQNKHCASNMCNYGQNCYLPSMGYVCNDSCGFSEYLTCSSSYCQRTNSSLKAYGAPCSSDNDCDSGLYCGGDIYRINICVAGILYNKCFRSDQCKNSACVSYSYFKICSAGGLKDPCDEDKHCMNGLICSAGFCN